jgi:hypothetical protein|tara:strand:- start:925 stop:1338 length:414 start_codon:yes stop_codon:yes gene_type:complete
VKCKTCGANAESEYCFRHKPRKPLPRTSSRFAKKLDKPVKSEEEIRQISEMREFFLQLWKKLPHYSMVSGKYLGKEPLTVFFHHVLPKEKYPEASLDEQNIILLTLEEHNQVEMDIYRYEEVNIRRNLLKAKYERAK